MAAADTVNEVTNAGRGLVSSVFNSMKSPTTWGALAIGIGLYVQSGGLLAAAQTAGTTAFTGAETGFELLSEGASSVKEMIVSSAAGTGAAPVP